MRNIAIIPARSGSKGLKDKNIKELDGKPLLAYSVEAAFKSKQFDMVHVSTDSAVYAAIAQKYGADVPFLRSTELASNSASTWDAIRFVLKEYEKRSLIFDTVTVLQPTSPLRTAEDIVNAFFFFNNKNAKMISSVCKMEHSPLWSNILPDDLSMENFEREDAAFLPRQAQPVYYRENGAIYIVRTEQLFKNINIYKDKCYAYIMEQSHSIDIDEEIDFCMAEFMIKMERRNGKR